MPCWTLFVRGEEALAAIGFFKYDPPAVTRTLRQIAYRADLRSEEVALLLAIARQATYAAAHPQSGGAATNKNSPTAGAVLLLALALKWVLIGVLRWVLMCVLTAVLAQPQAVYRRHTRRAAQPLRGLLKYLPL